MRLDVRGRWKYKLYLSFYVIRWNQDFCVVKHDDITVILEVNNLRQRFRTSVPYVALNVYDSYEASDLVMISKRVGIFRSKWNCLYRTISHKHLRYKNCSNNMFDITLYLLRHILPFNNICASPMMYEIKYDSSIFGDDKNFVYCNGFPFSLQWSVCFAINWFDP